VISPAPANDPERERKLKLWAWAVIGGAAVLGLGVTVYSALAPDPSDPAAAKPTAAAAAPPQASAPGAAPGAPAASATAGGALVESSRAPDAGPATRPTVKLVFTTVPAARATVVWGKHRLGTIAPRAPLIVERPRDSGPLDIVVRSPGFLPVHTRAYTFDDAVVDIRLTPLAKKDTLYGYRAPLPTDAGAAPIVP
jgi:hypothetical protein